MTCSKTFFLLFKFFLVFQLSVTLNINEREKSELFREIKKLSLSLNNVLDFVNQHSSEMNIDGALGIVLTEAQLLQSVENTKNKKVRLMLEMMIEKCQTLKNIIPALEQDSKRNKLFSHFLLNPNSWKNSVQFQRRQLKDLGVYESWTIKDIVKNKSAVYGGVVSDECLIEILEETPIDLHFHSCSASSRCGMYMFGKRKDNGYVLTHRLLYLFIMRMVHCQLNPKVMARTIRHYCTLILKEVKTNIKLGLPQRDIFLEQVVLCGMEGFTDFLQKDWITFITEWQTAEGCFQENQIYVNNNDTLIKTRSANIIAFGCTDHTTGLGGAALALNLRYVLQTLETF